MYMLLWDADPSKRMKINSPASISGNITAIEGHFGPQNKLANIGPVTGDVVLYNNASDTFHSACDVAGNADELKGKIALFTILGGSCEFYVTQVLNAQHAGAIAVIMMGLPGEPLFGWTAPPGYEDSVKVPAVLISYEDGIKIRTVLSAGSSVNITLFPLIDKDGDLDNGIIAHEYTHGISDRLTGGPSTVSCLFNAEQMGEGWSDYISLMTVTDWHKAHKGDGALPRTLATYVLNQPPNGGGVRQFPYSTDMTINPHTYADIAATSGEPHGIGEVWTSVLWDMTWNIIEQEGINKDIFNTNGGGGNSIAYKLVIEGLKLQPCSPGFIDGRDAILKADTLLYNGKHSCAIWNAFARRGIGLGASQGSTDKLGDERVDFTMGAVYITKHADKKSAAPGRNINYTIGLKAKSVCGARVEQNYSVTDSLPGNVTYVSSDGVYNPANRTVSFNNIDMNDGDSLTLKIKVKVKNNASFSDTVYIDEHDQTVIPDTWVAHNGKSLAWTVYDYFGSFFYYSGDTTGKDESNLATAQAYLVPGTKTTFSVYHQFYSNDFNNGGVIEISTDGGDNWQDLGPYMDPAGLVYNETITGNSVLKGRRAFSGFDNANYGYTTIDLSAFAGKNVRIRFRYATSDNSFVDPFVGGWVIDGIILSASPAALNTAKLFDQENKLRGSSSVEIKIEGKNLPSFDFVAVKHNTEALLTWHTPVENNNGFYQVERSTNNGANFKAIGSLTSVDDKEEIQSYDFTDASPGDGLNLYRIKHVSINGAVDYSGARSVIFDNLKGVKVFPNPAKDRIMVCIPGNDKPVTLRLINASGNQVKTYRMTGQNIELNLPVLSHGIYYLDIRRNTGKSRHTIVIE